jgi:hypothetical protein
LKIKDHIDRMELVRGKQDTTSPHELHPHRELPVERRGGVIAIRKGRFIS